MSWWSILKFNPRLRELARGDVTHIQLGDEKQMKEMWDASNPDMPHEMRPDEWIYPIDNWYGTLVNYDENKETYSDGRIRLVSVIGNSIHQGKGDKPFAFIGGTKTHPDYQKQGLMTGAREKALEPISNMPKIARYTAQGKASFMGKVTKPTSHEIIPDEILESMKERTSSVKEMADWGIFKWQQILKNTVKVEGWQTCLKN